MFVLLGNLVYGRWFLDGSDPDVRLVAVIHIYFVQLMLGRGTGKEVALDSYTLPLFSDVGFFFQPILRENLFFVSYFFLTLK